MTHNVPTERVLSTLNHDGTRRWIRPEARARSLPARAGASSAYALIALFVLLPRIRIGGRPALLIDLMSRELDVFGAVFRPSDGFVLALLGLTIVLAVFLVTALCGRVWCGWGCPQTVYLELVFRPIERWLEGSRGQRATPWRTRRASGSLFAALVVRARRTCSSRTSSAPIGSSSGCSARRSSIRSASGIVVGVAALMLFDFGWFREQMCIVACPYGRLQSVLLDKQSLIVGYDAQRGEPRAQAEEEAAGRSAAVTASTAARASPCARRASTSATACRWSASAARSASTRATRVMDKLGRKRGPHPLHVAGRARGQASAALLRVRTIVYPLLLALALGGARRGPSSARTGTEVWVERVSGRAFVELPDGDDLVAGAHQARERDRRDAPLSPVARADAPTRSLRSQTDCRARAAQVAARFRCSSTCRATRSSTASARVHLRIDDSDRVRAHRHRDAARTRTEIAMSAGTKWILAIVGLLAVNVLAAVILIVVANGSGQSQVLPSYGIEAK